MTDALLPPREGLRTAVEAALEAGGASTDVGAVLRRYWRYSKEALFSAHSARSVSGADGGGHSISTGLSQAMDNIVMELCEAVCGEGIAILATGGYGRGRLAPFSDVDLLILANGDDHEARLAPFLYAMWDGGLPLSHSAHTPATAVASASEDTVTCTAFLDARFLGGDEALFHRFQGRFDKLRRRSLSAFVEAKLRERDDRHDRTEASRYAIEPDIKEGKGGLRDLDTLHWLDRYVSGLTESGIDGATFETPGLFSPREERRLRRISEFLWSTRVHLHDISGRADEKLHFSIQPEVAERLGFRARGGGTAVERFMRFYFLNAREVGKLTGAACALLEERALKETQLGQRVVDVVGRFFGQDGAVDGEANLVRRGGRLSFSDHQLAQGNLRDIFALFLISGRHDLPVHPDAFHTAARAARRMTPASVVDPELAAIFRNILRESCQLEAVLRGMTECGILGRFLPSYGKMVGKVEYGLFRRFTIDEHILRSIGVLNDMLHDRDDGRYKITKPMAKAFADPAPLYLALLLQESKDALEASAAANGDNDGTDPIRQKAMRLLDDPAHVDLVVFALNHRDLLFRVASRRSVTDLHVVESLCQQIKDEERLSCLAVLTSCRHRTAGLRSWEEYAKRDVRLLVESIRAYFDGGAAGLAGFLEDRRQGLRKRARGLLPPPQAAVFDQFIERTGPTFWSMADVTVAADLALLVDRVEAAGQVGGAAIVAEPGGTLTILLYAEDKPSMFADCAGLVAQVGGTVWDAWVFPLAPRRDGNGSLGPARACHSFQVNRAGSPPQPFEMSAEERETVRQRFEALARGDGAAPTVPAPLVGDRRTVFDVTPIIQVQQDLSADALIVEVQALDRPGLLHFLAKGLAKIGVSIQLAFVATYGHRAVDTFYLQDIEGRKITDPAQIDQIKAHLFAVLEAV